MAGIGCCFKLSFFYSCFWVDFTVLLIGRCPPQLCPWPDVARRALSSVASRFVFWVRRAIRVGPVRGWGSAPGYSREVLQGSAHPRSVVGSVHVGHCREPRAQPGYGTIWDFGQAYGSRWDYNVLFMSEILGPAGGSFSATGDAHMQLHRQGHGQHDGGPGLEIGITVSLEMSAAEACRPHCLHMQPRPRLPLYPELDHHPCPLRVSIRAVHTARACLPLSHLNRLGPRPIFVAGLAPMLPVAMFVVCVPFLVSHEPFRSARFLLCLAPSLLLSP